MERLRRRPVNGSTRKGVDEAGSEEDGEDTEVLGSVVYGDAFVTRTKGILYERTEVVWQWHVVGRCVDADKLRRVPARGATRCAGERCGAPIIK